MSDTTSTAPVTTAPPDAAAAPTAETSASASPAASPEVPKLGEKLRAEQWAKHAAEEKRIRKERERLEGLSREINEKSKALADLDALKAKAKAGDPEAIDRLVSEFGVDYDALTRFQLRGRKVDPGEKTARELAELKASIEREKAEAQQRSEREAWDATTSDFRAHVLKEAPSDYPLLAGELEAEPDYIDSVLRSIEKHARESGQPTTIRDAAMRLERYFREQTERRAARLNKPAATEVAAPPPETSTDKARPRDQQTGRFAGGDGPRRLTNDLSAERSVPAKSREPGRKLTMRERDEQERERIRRGANAMR